MNDVALFVIALGQTIRAMLSEVRTISLRWIVVMAVIVAVGLTVQLFVA